MINFLLSIIGGIFFLFGVIALMSPIPIGLIFITLGLSILVCSNLKAQILLKKYRTESHKINERVHRLEEMLENRMHRLREALIKTRPSEGSLEEEA